MWAPIVVAYLLCYAGNTLCFERLEPPGRAGFVLYKYHNFFFPRRGVPKSCPAGLGVCCTSPQIYYSLFFSQARRAQELPSPYVKTYVLPDPEKQTKRKTKTIKNTVHPTYNEVVSILCCRWNECGLYLL
jgi:hypothetical protein